MTYEYLALHHQTMKTSLHTEEDLDHVLNVKGKDGWKLAHVLQHNGVHWTLIFERQHE